MAGEPSHVKQLSLNHVCKIGLKCLVFLYFGDTILSIPSYSPTGGFSEIHAKKNKSAST
jgi:hypothetical protein